MNAPLEKDAKSLLESMRVHRNEVRRANACSSWKGLSDWQGWSSYLYCRSLAAGVPERSRILKIHVRDSFRCVSLQAAERSVQKNPRSVQGRECRFDPVFHTLRSGLCPSPRDAALPRFALPLKEEHKVFLERSLIPLHKVCFPAQGQFPLGRTLERMGE